MVARDDSEEPDVVSRVGLTRSKTQPIDGVVEFLGAHHGSLCEPAGYEPELCAVVLDGDRVIAPFANEDALIT